MDNLSQTWVVIQIGNRKYAVNIIYVQSIIELDKVMYKSPCFESTFIKGVYDIHGAAVTVLDGRKLICEQTIDEKKIQFAKYINDIRYEHEAWLDSVEWELLTGDKLDSASPVDSSLKSFLDEFKADESICRIINKMKQPFEVLHSQTNIYIRQRRQGEAIADVTNIISELRRQSKNYIVSNLNKIIDINNEKLTEMCIIVKAKDIIYGISIDSVETITDQAESLSNTEKTVLSAGEISIKGIKYNVLNLTKLAKII